MFDPTALVESARKAAGVPVGAVSDDDLFTGVQALEEARRAIDAAQGAFLSELDARDLTDRRHGHRTRAWFAATHGVEPREAARRCRVGRSLRSLEVVAEALADGRVSLEHVRVLTASLNPRVAPAVRAAQQVLVDLAATMAFDDWARHVRALVAHADPDGGHDPGPERQSLKLGRGLDGELFLRGTLTGGAAATVEHVLETHADRLFRRASADRDATGGELATPSRAQLRADALGELLRAGAAALGQGTARAPAADVTLTVPHDHPALVDRGGRGAVRCGTGVEVGGAELDVLLCDAAFTAVVVDGLGTPIDAGRTSRSATPRQRRALAVRDGGCAFPGCTAPPRWCDAHHVVDWEHHGATDLDNLLLLCRHHHGVVHRRGWSVRHTGDQHFEITTASGSTLPARRRGRASPGP